MDIKTVGCASLPPGQTQSCDNYETIMLFSTKISTPYALQFELTLAGSYIETQKK
jgi:hypothetical protein